jgi:membrane protein required for beta-lactamase induction
MDASSAAQPPARPGSRRAVASYSNYRDAERAVDWLSDQGFAVERVAIVGSGLRSVEQVAGRLTIGRAALSGALQGILIGLLFALLFGIFFTGPEFFGLLVYAIVAGAIFGAVFGAVAHGAQGGQRDFTSVRGIEAERYEVQVDEEAADEAKRLLDSMPAGRR